jgi:hypothetical protein
MREPSRGTRIAAFSTMQLLTKLAARIGLVVLTGCTSLALAGGDPTSLRSATLVEACPLGVPGTRLQVAEAKDGIYVFFTTRMSSVDDIRLRARDQAKVNGPDRHLGRGHFGEHKGARNHGLRLWALGKVATEVVDTPSGARMSIIPADPARRDEVRAAVTRRVAEIESAGCPD